MQEGIIAWARFAGIPVAMVDCDAEHLTLIQNKVLRVKDSLTRLAIDEFNPLDIHE